MITPEVPRKHPEFALIPPKKWMLKLRGTPATEILVLGWKHVDDKKRIFVYGTVLGYRMGKWIEKVSHGWNYCIFENDEVEEQ